MREDASSRISESSISEKVHLLASSRISLVSISVSREMREGADGAPNNTNTTNTHTNKTITNFCYEQTKQMAQLTMAEVAAVRVRTCACARVRACAGGAVVNKKAWPSDLLNKTAWPLVQPESLA